MPSIITYTLWVLIALFTFGLLIELAIFRVIKRFISDLLIFSILVCILFMNTDFPSIYQSYGGISNTISLLIMFICIILGMIAQYLFFLENGFSLKAFWKPFLISPLILFSIKAVVPFSSEIEYGQLISLGLLSFQNGFFWKIVFERISINAKENK